MLSMRRRGWNLYTIFGKVSCHYHG